MSKKKGFCLTVLYIFLIEYQVSVKVIPWEIVENRDNSQIEKCVSFVLHKSIQQIFDSKVFCSLRVILKVHGMQYWPLCSGHVLIYFPSVTDQHFLPSGLLRFSTPQWISINSYQGATGSPKSSHSFINYLSHLIIMCLYRCTLQFLETVCEQYV